MKRLSFIREPQKNAAPFSDVGTAAGVDDPSRMLDGWTGWATRTRAMQPGASDADIAFEARVGRYQTSPAALLHILAERRRPVAIISAQGRNYEGKEGRWSGTGFLVGRNLLLTNHHVLNTIEVGRAARVEFDYEISPENLLSGDGRTPPTAKTFNLDPTRLFITSPAEGGLDYTFVWIEEAAANAYGTVPLERSSLTVNKGDFAFIIHHPDGQPKQVSLDDTDVVGIEATVIHYSSDTLAGSSGAPVFDRQGRLIALHHASRPWSEMIPGGEQTDRINEGIKIAAIAIDLETRARRGGSEADYATSVLKEIKGSDTLSGFFGGLGRKIDPDKTGPEAVVDTYRGTDQDIDVGFWNIEWLANRWEQPGKLEGVAKVITDLNLDLWGLSEVSRPAVQALVEHIREVYGEIFEYALSEPDAPPSKQSTAMIWKASSLTGERVEWPESVEPLFRQRSDAPDLRFEAVHGKIFDRYPALYRFATAAGLPVYTFFAVPLHLKAMAEGSLRRRLASRILARAVERLITQEHVDVVLGGDMNAPLASSDFFALEEAGFALLGAQDEREGAFTYVKSPNSAIDNIFLSPGMTQTVGKVDYFVVARDRVMPDYLAISDHRPIAMRLSLSSNPSRRVDNPALDGIIDQMLREAARPPPTERVVETPVPAASDGRKRRTRTASSKPASRKTEPSKPAVRRTRKRKP